MQIGPCFQGRIFRLSTRTFARRARWIAPARQETEQTIPPTYPKHSFQLQKRKKLEQKVFVYFFLAGHGTKLIIMFCQEVQRLD